MQKETTPMTKADVKNSPDPKIDEDFKGYPAAPSKENVINPKSPDEKKTAALNVKDGEKMDKEDAEKDEAESDASGGAFEGTENMRDDE